MSVEAEARVLGGFPVLARGTLCGPQRDVGLMSSYLEDVEVTLPDGRPCPFIKRRMTPADWDRVHDALMDAASDW